MKHPDLEGGKRYVGGNGESVRPRVTLGAGGTCREPDGGVEIFTLIPGGPAEAAGLQHGDVIAGVRVRDEKDLARVLNGPMAGQELVLDVRRGDRELRVRVRPAEWSEAEEGRAYDRLIAAQARANRVPWWTKWYKLRSLIGG